jgi:hypothetical protein
MNDNSKIEKPTKTKRIFTHSIMTFVAMLLAYWNWSFFFNTLLNYNLIRITEDGRFYTTQHFETLENAYSELYGS